MYRYNGLAKTIKEKASGRIDDSILRYKSTPIIRLDG